MAKIVCIDAGHGGTDGGADANGYVEKTLALKIARYMNEFLTADPNYTPKMTRSTDTYVSVNDRAAICNNASADLFISIHFNAGGGTGFEVYPHVPKESYHSESHSFAEKVVSNMKDITTMRGLNGVRFAYLVNGVRSFAEANDTNSKGYSTYYGVVRQAKCPAVLIETAFIDTAADIAKFSTDAKLKIAAARYYRAVCDYFGTTPIYDVSGNSISSSTTTTSTTTLYRVQVGAFSSMANAEAFLTQVKAKGYTGSFLVSPTTDKLYRVQVGSFSVKSNAENYMKEVQSKGLAAFIVTVAK